MRIETEIQNLPRITDVMTIGALWFGALALVAAISVVGASTVGDAVTRALLAGLMAVVAVLSVKYGREYARSGGEAEIRALMADRRTRPLRDETEDHSKAA